MRVFGSGYYRCWIGRRGHSGIKFLDSVDFGEYLLDLGNEALSPWADNV